MFAIIAIAMIAAVPAFATPAENAEVTVSVPLTVASGETFQITVTVKNTGTTTWSREAGYCIGVGAGYPTEEGYKTGASVCGPIISQAYPWPDPSWDDHNRIWFAEGDSIGPGQTRTLSATMQAPVILSSTGYFWVPFSGTVRMVKENDQAIGWPDGWFGQARGYFMAVIPTIMGDPGMPPPLP